MSEIRNISQAALAAVSTAALVEANRPGGIWGARSQSEFVAKSAYLALGRSVPLADLRPYALWALESMAHAHRFE